MHVQLLSILTRLADEMSELVTQHPELNSMVSSQLIQWCKEMHNLSETVRLIERDAA